ncbi:uncharacterized protein LOC110459117 [Mizuhopecten yessoensis]|uniref:uncharacterized protein LOC110459117 n=1 Tax=Mizuhopecten yessoensis TaxID=6573 RepID=UPI000B45E5EC|nr:uncharacterized protein LOC110459117 [Mizuhopecten yessoensis]XP_021366889.1 uncharacterized protein LOC110459117 [Mizuhopecten yessoensis]
MVAHLVSRPTCQSNTSDIALATDTCRLRTKYPERFRTAASQATYETSVDGILKRAYHGCCSTKQLFYSPTSIKCIDGTTSSVAVFAGYKQYFQYDSCNTTESCTDTECKCDDTLATAVYDNGDKEEGCDKRYGICAFKTKGCCKCVNK